MCMIIAGRQPWYGPSAEASVEIWCRRDAEYYSGYGGGGGAPRARLVESISQQQLRNPPQSSSKHSV